MNAFLNVNRADGKSGSCEILKSVRLLQLHENEFLPSFLFFFLFLFIFKLYKIVLVLPNIKMNRRKSGVEKRFIQEKVRSPRS